MDDKTPRTSPTPEVAELRAAAESLGQLDALLEHIGSQRQPRKPLDRIAMPIPRFPDFHNPGFSPTAARVRLSSSGSR